MKIFEVVYQIQATDEQTSDILNTTSHVERNLKEAERLLRIKCALLDKHDHEWIASTIRDTRGGLQSVAKLIEPARVEKMTKKDIGMVTKTCWAFKSNPQARDKHAMLNVCHQTLICVINRLHSINIPTVLEKPDQGNLLPPPPYDNKMEKLWSWRDQRKNRKRSTTSLSQDFKSVSSFLATTDRQELEAPSLGSGYCSTAPSSTDSQQGNSANDFKSYNMDIHPIYRDAPTISAPSHSEAFEFSTRLMPPIAPYSLNGWPNASHSSISLPESAVELPSANRKSIHPVHMSHEIAANFHRESPMVELSGTPTSSEQQWSLLIGPDIGQSRKPIDRTMSSSLVPGNSTQSWIPDSTGSNVTSQSCCSLVSAEKPHPSSDGSEMVDRSGTSNWADSLAHNRLELEAETEERGAPSFALDGRPGADATGPESTSVDQMWASGARSYSSPALVNGRPSIGERVPSTGNRSGGGMRLRGSWLAYQTSLRNSRHGREGAGGI